jgi:hypothetical protein
MGRLLADGAMADGTTDAGARALLTFLEAEFAGEDVTRLSSPPGARLPADAVYFRIEGDQGLVGTVGATPEFLAGESTTALVERLHREDVPGAIRRAGADACTMLASGARPTTVPLG